MKKPLNISRRQWLGYVSKTTVAGAALLSMPAYAKASGGKVVVIGGALVVQQQLVILSAVTQTFRSRSLNQLKPSTPALSLTYTLVDYALSSSKAMVLKIYVL